MIGAAEDTSLDAVVRAGHDEAQARVGDETGSPVTVLDGIARSPAPEPSPPLAVDGIVASDPLGHCGHRDDRILAMGGTPMLTAAN